MIDQVDECIYEINDILAIITKGDKWQALANRLSKLLVQKWNEEQAEAIRDTIRFLASGKSKEITKEEFDIARLELEEKLGSRLAEVFRKDVKKIQLESYTKGYTNIGIDFEFNAVDKKALMWLFEKDVKQFWIGESYTTELNEKLNKITSDVLKAGLGRSDAAKLFKDSLGDEFNKTDHYWELLAEHTVTRSREFGRTSAYESAGVDYIKIVNPSPESEICKFLNGKIIPVSRAVDQRNKLMKAKTVDQVKKIAPWYNDRKVLSFAAKGKIPKNIGLPPYHPYCFPKDTIIQTINGNKPINEVKKGDMVLTHKKRYMSVDNLISRHYIGLAIRTKTKNSDLTCTPEHPILVKKGEAYYWMPAKDITIGDIVCRVKKKEL